MDDLIAALTILRKYGNPASPTNCCHDELWIMGINPADVSPEDCAELKRLGFDIREDAFCSYRFGSA